MMARRGLNQRDLRAMHSMLSAVFFSYAFFLCCFARDTITYPSAAIGLDRQESLVSAGKRFELGFFTPEESTVSRIYLGIWYYKSNPRIVVWVANRNSPLPDDEAGLAITGDGNLQISHGDGTSYWSTELPSTSNPAYREAKLLDSGNMVFGDSNNTLLTTILWESFAHPTDTFLPGMNMSENLKLISWENTADPKEGKFSFQLDEGRNQFVILTNDYTVHWANGESSDFFSSERMPDGMTNFLLNPPGSLPPLIPNYTTLPPSDYNNTRIRLDVEGELQYWKLDMYTDWSLQWKAPRDNCSVSNVCGDFGSCNLNNMLACRCLPGFKPTSPESWSNGDFSGGCSRSSASCGKNDTFSGLKMMRVGQEDNKYAAENETICREMCLNNCSCQAYSFVEVANRRREPINLCLIWTDVLKDLQEDDSYGGRDLFVRVAIAGTELKAKSCKPCGINVIPYPLSTGSDCGDPMYFSFYCDTPTGKLSFNTQNGTYNVATIAQDIRTFVIQYIDGDHCTGGQLPEFNLSFPFKKIVKPWCVTVAGNFGSNITSQGLVEIVIGWEPPPLEPLCTSSADCEDWPNSTCNVAGNGKMRCQCNSNFWWDGMALNCAQDVDGQSGGSSRKKKPFSLIVGVAIASVIVLSTIFLYTCILMRKKAKRRESQQNTERNAALMYGTEKRVKNFIDAEELNEEDKKDIDVPFFDLDSILAATDYFSEENKLGRGGFGPVYKGKFPGGQEIAIKRLSSVSGQGLEEFKNEVILIARLQHRNLVRLVGYCIKGVEKILLYEYMPNKSLDSFIFDRALGILLNWETRFDIILGVARGLLYLHQDSRLRIIHRDMKTSNILLDAEMNPKISDFGLARMFEGKQTEGSTNRVVGTYGYMAPEYAMDGVFSMKSDVFSFGVVVLEILSGKRNKEFYKSDQGFSLSAYAWRLWKEEKVLDLMDRALCETCDANEFVRCVNVGLLCVQEHPWDRPTMSSVALMLGSDTASLPTPNKPAFSASRSLSDTASSSSPADSYVELTNTLEQGR